MIIEQNKPMQVLERIEFHNARFLFWKGATRVAGNAITKAKRHARAMAHFEKAKQLAKKL